MLDRDQESSKEKLEIKSLNLEIIADNAYKNKAIVHFNFFAPLYKTRVCLLIKFLPKMNIQELMNAVPHPIVEIIIKYTLEFHRADAIERTLQFRSIFDTHMKQICEDVRMNTAKCHI